MTDEDVAITTHGTPAVQLRRASEGTACVPEGDYGATALVRGNAPPSTHGTALGGPTGCRCKSSQFRRVVADGSGGFKVQLYKDAMCSIADVSYAVGPDAQRGGLSELEVPGVNHQDAGRCSMAGQDGTHTSSLYKTMQDTMGNTMYAELSSTDLSGSNLGDGEPAHVRFFRPTATTSLSSEPCDATANKLKQASDDSVDATIAIFQESPCTCAEETVARMPVVGSCKGNYGMVGCSDDGASFKLFSFSDARCLEPAGSSPTDLTANQAASMGAVLADPQVGGVMHADCAPSQAGELGTNQVHGPNISDWPYRQLMCFTDAEDGFVRNGKARFGATYYADDQCSSAAYGVNPTVSAMGCRCLDDYPTALNSNQQDGLTQRWENRRVLAGGAVDGTWS